MRLWCKKCGTLMEHRVTKTYVGNSTRGRRIHRVDRIMLDPHGGVIPLVIHAVCECFQRGRFVGNEVNDNVH